MIKPGLTEQQQEQNYKVSIQSMCDIPNCKADEDGFEEISLADTSSSSNGDSSSVTESDSTSSTCSCEEHPPKPKLAVYQDEMVYSRKNIVTFHTPLVTNIREVARISLAEKCLLFYTDEDMLKFREEYLKVLRKSVPTDSSTSLLSMFTSIFCEDEDLCIENDICHCLTAVLSLASKIKSSNVEVAPAYKKSLLKNQKQQKQQKCSSLSKEQKLITRETTPIDDTLGIDIYDVLYLY